MAEVEQLDLFATAPAPVQAPVAETVCGWRREHLASIEPCVLAPGHDGDHLVWHQGAHSVTIWTVNPANGQGTQRLHARVTQRRRFTPPEIRAMVDVATAAFASGADA